MSAVADTSWVPDRQREKLAGAGLMEKAGQSEDRRCASVEGRRCASVASGNSGRGDCRGQVNAVTVTRGALQQALRVYPKVALHRQLSPTFL